MQGVVESRREGKETKGGEERMDIGKEISSKNLVNELISRGARYYDAERYGTFETVIKKKYSTDMEVEYPKRVLVLDHLDFK